MVSSDRSTGRFSQKFFDIMMTLPDQEHPYEKLQQELARQCGLTAHFETNDVDVLFLKQSNAGPSGLVPSNGGTPSVSLDLKKGELVIINWRLSDFANQFDNILGIPVFDETGIQGNYTCTSTWKQRPGESMNGAFKRAVSEQLGLRICVRPKNHSDARGRKGEIRLCPDLKKIVVFPPLRTMGECTNATMPNFFPPMPPGNRKKRLARW